MDWISIKQALLAVLWLEEKKLNISEEKMQGQWDLAFKEPNLMWPYEKIVSSLGLDFFSNSLYYDPLNDVCDFTNLLNGIVILEGDQIKIDSDYCQTDLKILHEELSLELDRMIKEAVKTELFGQVQNVPSAATSTRIVESVDFLDKAEKLNKDIEINKKTLPSDFVYIDDYHFIASKLNAIVSLLNRLANGTLLARAFPTVISTEQELFDTNKSDKNFQFIPAKFWQEKPLVHFNISNVHAGKRQNYWLKEFFPDSNNKQLKGREEFWLTNIQIEKEKFLDWIMPEIHRLNPIPKKAIFKRLESKYYMQFGEEAGVLLPANKGFRALHQIMQKGRVNNFSDGIGACPHQVRAAVDMDLVDRMSDSLDGNKKVKLKAEDIESYLKLVKRHWQLSEEIEILEEAGYTSSFTDEISKDELASFDENSSGDLFSVCDDDDSDTVSYDATWNAFNDPKINGLRRELERNYKRLGEITKFLNDNSGVSKDYVELTAKFLQSKPSEQELSSLKIKDLATVDSSTQKDIDAVRTNVQYAIKEYIKGKNNNLYYHLGDWSGNQQFGALRVIENKLTYIADKELQWEWK